MNTAVSMKTKRQGYMAYLYFLAYALNYKREYRKAFTKRGASRLNSKS